MRKSSDQRSVDSSPRLIAASYVLHRLLVPRHPPCALNNLTTQTPTPTHNEDPATHMRHPGPVMDQRGYPDTYLQDTPPFPATCIDARVHCAVLNVRAVTPHPPPPDPGPPRAVRRA